jgi:3-oxoacyl-[acyl-carrier-protein] synthase III
MQAHYGVGCNPQHACLLQVQAMIGAGNALAFDLTAACSGFVVGLVTGAQFIRTRAYRNVLVIGADALSRYVDWRDRGARCSSASCLFWHMLA